ncbi:N1R/p28 family protein [Avipoxvirus sp.]|nr:N1R/p28 family protein [Avipoxvirus sp.]
MNTLPYIIQDIDSHFCYIKYDGITLTMMKDNGYINATQLCMLGNKDFKEWIKLDHSIELIKEIEKNINKETTKYVKAVISVRSDYYNSETSNDIKGFYIHGNIMPHICAWISSKFAIKVSNIVHNYLNDRYVQNDKEEIHQEPDKDIKYIKKQCKLMREIRILFKKNYTRELDELKKVRELYYEKNKGLEEYIDKLEYSYTQRMKELTLSIYELKNSNKQLKNKLENIEKRIKCINPPTESSKNVIYDRFKKLYHILTFRKSK